MIGALVVYCVVCAAVIVLFVYTVKALNSGWCVEETTCPASHMRWYLLLTLIGGGSSLGVNAKNASGLAAVFMYAVVVSVLAAYAIWGIVEIYANACPSVVGTLLYTMTVVHTCLAWIPLIIGVVLGGAVATIRVCAIVSSWWRPLRPVSTSRHADVDTRDVSTLAQAVV